MSHGRASPIDSGHTPLHVSFLGIEDLGGNVEDGLWIEKTVGIGELSAEPGSSLGCILDPKRCTPVLRTSTGSVWLPQDSFLRGFRETKSWDGRSLA